MTVRARSSRGRLVVLVAAGLGLPLAVGVGAIALSGDSSPGGCSIRPVPPRAAEVGPVIAGPDPLAWQVYDERVEELPLRHNHLHGGIAVQYGERVPAAEVRRITGWYDRDPVALLVAPLPDLGTRVRATAWASSLDCRGFDDAEFSAFRDAHRFRGPERVTRAELQPALGAGIVVSPTPVRVAATIEFTLLDGDRVQVVIRDSSNRTVRRLGSFVGSAGQRLALRWDGRDEAGRRVAPGRYEVVVRSARRAPRSARFVAR